MSETPKEVFGALLAEVRDRDADLEYVDFDAWRARFEMALSRHVAPLVNAQNAAPILDKPVENLTNKRVPGLPAPLNDRDEHDIGPRRIFIRAEIEELAAKRAAMRPGRGSVKDRHARDRALYERLRDAL